jgi:hypothetical protein
VIDFRACFCQVRPPENPGSDDALDPLRRRIARRVVRCAGAAEKRVALVVGNSTYQNVSRLQNPKSDAQLVADTLQRLG